MSKKLSISERAQTIINYSKNNNSIGIISIFKNLCLPFNNENLKKQLFENIFFLSNIPYIWDDKIGFIIFSENHTKKTIVSHMDLISIFNNGFKNNKSHEIKDNNIYGALDNTFTNAILINSILNNQNKDTTYLFTLDEETTQYAIRDYMKRFGTEQFIINLDISNDGYEKNMSIEYDKPCYHICKQINNNLDNPHFTKDRVCDDLDEVMKADGYGFSYCLPTKGNIHSFKNYTSIDKIEPYMNGLEFLIHSLDLSCFKPNINYLDISKAISFNSFEEFKQKDIVPERTTINSIYKKKFEKEFFSREFSIEFNKFIIISSIKKNKFRDFVLHSLKHDLSYSESEIYLSFPSLDIAELLNKGFIYLIPNGSKYLFKFNSKYIFKEETIDKEKFHELILKMTAYFDKGEILHMKKFLDIVSTDNDFSELDFDNMVQGWMLYSLSDYELFKQKTDGGYKINYSFSKDNAFKSWKIANKLKEINSPQLFSDFMNKKRIIYSDFISYEKNRNIKNVDKLITQLMSAKLIKVSKKEKNSFKVL